MGMSNTFKVVISAYSLARGEIGKPFDRLPVIREHDKVEDAMRDLYDSIKKNEGYVVGEGQMKMIEMPDGRHLPLLKAYVETFGVEPVKQDNREDLYPMLFPKGRKGKKQ